MLCCYALAHVMIKSNQIKSNKSNKSNQIKSYLKVPTLVTTKYDGKVSEYGRNWLKDTVNMDSLVN